MIISMYLYYVLLLFSSLTFRGYHRCGVTMLNGPIDNTPSSESPTILVSAAHCNYVCKVIFCLIKVFLSPTVHSK